MAGAISDGLESGKRLQRQLLDLMDVSRAESGALPLRLAETDLGALVKATAGDARLVGNSRSISLIPVVPPDPVAKADVSVLGVHSTTCSTTRFATRRPVERFA